MKRFNNILICGHPDQVDVKLLEHAADIANHNQANVKVIHVVTDYPKNVRNWWNVRNPGKLRNKIIREREDFLDGLVESLKKFGVENVTRELHWGEPLVEVANEVIHNHHDLVMVVSKHSGKVSYSTFGYSSMDLLRQCPIPIWVAQKKVKKRVHRIVAALGGSGGEIKIEDTNAKILEYAAAVAEAEKSQVHIVHAMPLYGSKSRKKHRDEWLGADLVAYIDNVRSQVKQHCNEYLAEHGISLSDDQLHLLIGMPTDVIPEFVESNHADLVVMASVARTGIPGLVVGNASEKVLPKIGCPLLIVKSDQFNIEFRQTWKTDASVA